MSLLLLRCWQIRLVVLTISSNLATNSKARKISHLLNVPRVPLKHGCVYSCNYILVAISSFSLGCALRYFKDKRI